jgi:hypothetical protein
MHLSKGESDGECPPPSNSSRKSRLAWLAAAPALSQDGVPSGGRVFLAVVTFIALKGALVAIQTGITRAHDHAGIGVEAEGPHGSGLVGRMMTRHIDIIPVIAVAWEFTGLNPEELEGRLTTVFERILTTTVDNIEHIESTPSIEFLVNPACDRSQRLGLLLDHSAPSSPGGKTT